MSIPRQHLRSCRLCSELFGLGTTSVVILKFNFAQVGQVCRISCSPVVDKLNERGSNRKRRPEGRRFHRVVRWVERFLEPLVDHEF